MPREGPEVEVVRDASALPADLGAVDQLARAGLSARRRGRRLRLRGVSPELLALLDLCGLADVLGARRQPEEREQPRGVEERVDACDPPV